MLPFELIKDTPYLALSGELWSVFYEYVNRNWSCYRGFLLYIHVLFVFAASMPLVTVLLAPCWHTRQRMKVSAGNSFNSLNTGRCGSSLKSLVFQLIIQNSSLGILCVLLWCECHTTSPMRIGSDNFDPDLCRNTATPGYSELTSQKILLLCGQPCRWVPVAFT